MILANPPTFSLPRLHPERQAQLAVIVLFFVLSVVSLSQKSIYRQAAEAYERHDYMSAEKLWRKNLRTLEEQRQNPLNEIEAWCREVGLISEDDDPLTDIDLSIWCSKMRLAESLMAQGRGAIASGEAESLLFDAYKLGGSPKLAEYGFNVRLQPLSRLEQLCLMQGRFDDAAVCRKEYVWMVGLETFACQRHRAGFIHK